MNILKLKFQEYKKILQILHINLHKFYKQHIVKFIIVIKYNQKLKMEEQLNLLNKKLEIFKIVIKDYQNHLNFMV